MTKNSKIEQGKNLAKLSQVKTFSRLTGSDNIDTSRLKGMMGAWCNNFLPGKIRIFLFKFYNNIPGLNYRVPAAKFNILTDPSCTFCSSSNLRPAERETFAIGHKLAQGLVCSRCPQGTVPSRCPAVGQCHGD